MRADTIIHSLAEITVHAKHLIDIRKTLILDFPIKFRATSTFPDAIFVSIVIYMIHRQECVFLFTTAGAMPTVV